MSCTANTLYVSGMKIDLNLYQVWQQQDGEWVQIDHWSDLTDDLDMVMVAPIDQEFDGGTLPEQGFYGTSSQKTARGRAGNSTDPAAVLNNLEHDEKWAALAAWANSETRFGGEGGETQVAKLEQTLKKALESGGYLLEIDETKKYMHAGVSGPETMRALQEIGIEGKRAAYLADNGWGNTPEQWVTLHALEDMSHKDKQTKKALTVLHVTQMRNTLNALAQGAAQHPGASVDDQILYGVQNLLAEQLRANGRDVGNWGTVFEIEIPSNASQTGGNKRFRVKIVATADGRKQLVVENPDLDSRGMYDNSYESAGGGTAPRLQAETRRTFDSIEEVTSYMLGDGQGARISRIKTEPTETRGLERQALENLTGAGALTTMSQMSSWAAHPETVWAAAGACGSQSGHLWRSWVEAGVIDQNVMAEAVNRGIPLPAFTKFQETGLNAKDAMAGVELVKELEALEEQIEAPVARRQKELGERELRRSRDGGGYVDLSGWAGDPTYTYTRSQRTARNPSSRDIDTIAPYIAGNDIMGGLHEHETELKAALGAQLTTEEHQREGVVVAVGGTVDKRETKKANKADTAEKRVAFIASMCEPIRVGGHKLEGLPKPVAAKMLALDEATKHLEPRQRDAVLRTACSLVETGMEETYKRMEQELNNKTSEWVVQEPQSDSALDRRSWLEGGDKHKKDAPGYVNVTGNDTTDGWRSSLRDSVMELDRLIGYTTAAAAVDQVQARAGATEKAVENAWKDQKARQQGVAAQGIHEFTMKELDEATAVVERNVQEAARTAAIEAREELARRSGENLPGMIPVPVLTKTPGPVDRVLAGLISGN